MLPLTADALYADARQAAATVMATADDCCADGGTDGGEGCAATGAAANPVSMAGLVKEPRLPFTTNTSVSTS